MSRLASTGLAGTLLAFAFSGTALAQTAPDDTNTGTPNTTSDADTDIDTDVDVDTTAPTPMSDQATDTDTIHTETDTTTTTAPPPPVDVDVNVQTPDPDPTIVNIPPPQSYDTQSTVIVDDEETDDGGVLSGIGIGIAAGGGTSGFTDNTMRDTTNVGGDWDVRLTLGTRSPIAFEGSYIGSAQSIDALGLDNDAVLVGNGVQGALRVNATLDLPVQPFAFGGAAWRRYDLTNADVNLSDVAGSDDVLEIPVGIGIAGKLSGFMLDLRGEYRYTTDEDLVPSATRLGENAEMNRWGAKLTAGVEF